MEHIDYEYSIIPKDVFKIVINTNFGNIQNKYYYKEKDKIFIHISESINKIYIFPYKYFFVCYDSNENRLLKQRELKLEKLKKD
jgi:hypothetical protein